ncbi:kinase A anchor protein [Dactylonectria estremocensis]|uniref:Kinase A anchor protein n=1 Tax=Dactylonectria estremocensis TaxID=1079267 RepID=A0A9P9F233_9HYPO|nr:kinase A anchor protein [Dactylonectria estremocensis]
MPPKPSPTHFLCVPVAGVQLARSLALFRDDVTSIMSFAVPPEAVRPLGTLHLTLGVMNLKEDGVRQAAELLRSLQLKEMLAKARASVPVSSTARAGQGEPASGDKGLFVTLQGLQAMQSPSKTSVLYAPPIDSDGVLYRLCQQLKATFQDAGFMTDDGRPLLLHASIINTIHVKAARGGGRRREKLTLDARDMLSRYDDYLWIEDMPVDRVTLCRMGAKRVEGTEDDEAYEVVAEAAL